MFKTNNKDSRVIPSSNGCRRKVVFIGRSTIFYFPIKLCGCTVASSISNIRFLLLYHLTLNLPQSRFHNLNLHLDFGFENYETRASFSQHSHHENIEGFCFSR